MTGINGIKPGNTSGLIAKFETLGKGSEEPSKSQGKTAPTKGEGMSSTATKRMNELNFRPQQSLSKSEKNELEGLKRQYDRPDLLLGAKNAQKSGGVLAGHAVALTKIADDRDICICIRGVNPLATGLVESGFGTKDMSIKAKSSNLPPLNGLIPFDQKYGKKGDDPVEVEKFTHKNEEAIEKNVATKVDAKMPLARLQMLENEPSNLRIINDAHGLQSNELLLVGNDFKSKDLPQGKDFHFIAVKTGIEPDENVTIYAAHQDENGAWKKDDKPIQVMANRDGKAVTADYDLALVAPRVKDLGPQHMSSLKMASFAELDRRTQVVERMAGKIETEFKRYTEALGKGDSAGAQTALDELAKLLPMDKMSEKDRTSFKEDMVKFKSGELTGEDLSRLGRKAAELDFYGTIVPEALKQNEERYAPSESNFERARNIILEAMAPPTGEAMSKEEFLKIFQNLTQIDLRADTRFESVVEGYPNLSQAGLTLLSNELGSSIEGTGYRDSGIVSSFVRDLVPELNQIVGQTGGREVFHHGDDVGNPYSVEKDNFPMTVILPEGATRGGDQIRVVMNADDFLSLAKDLKRQGYSVPVNEMWDSRAELFNVRTESFTEARNAIALQLGGSVQEMIQMANLHRKI